jgi:Glycosyl transferase family 90
MLGSAKKWSDMKNILVAFMFFFTVFYFPIFSSNIEKKFHNGIDKCPSWMDRQISHNLKYLENAELSISKLNELFQQIPSEFLVVKFTIKDNQVIVEKNFDHPCINARVSAYYAAFNDLCRLVNLPDVTFFIFLHDGLMGPGFGTEYEYFPLFVMSRSITNNRSILIPDYEAVASKYQVLEDRDITKIDISWREKDSRLVWRGGTGQNALDNSTPIMTSENLHLFSRVRLCELSLEHPDLIDAKFTFFSNENNLPYLNNFSGERIDFEELLTYKYQMLIHGNASSFSNSGWRFFSKSVVFIPDSLWTQWYYNELKPYIHYIPVKSDLQDLVERIRWAKHNDFDSYQIARNARKFALSHLTYSDHLLYLYFVLEKYSRLNFVE